VAGPAPGTKKGPLANARGPSLGRKRPRRAAIAQALPHRNNMPAQRTKRKSFQADFHAYFAWNRMVKFIDVIIFDSNNKDMKD
jgi:hypothetical protein